MKKVTISAVCLMLCLFTALAGTTVFTDSGVYNLSTGSGANPLTSVTGSGTLSQIGCVVTSAVSGNSGLYFGLLPEIDGSFGNTIKVYNGYLNSGYLYFDPSIAPFVSGGGANKGLSVGDSFVINLNMPYSTSLKVIPSFNGYAATSGAISCTVVHN